MKSMFPFFDDFIFDVMRIKYIYISIYKDILESHGDLKKKI